LKTDDCRKAAPFDITESGISSAFLRFAKIFSADAVVLKCCHGDRDAAIAARALRVVAGGRLYTKLSGYTVIFFSLV
jgi:hypothetical protein